VDDHHPTYLRRGVSHCGLAIYIKKYLKPRKELWKLKYFTMQKYNPQKIPLNETKTLPDIIHSITNLKFQHKTKYHLSKNPHIKIGLLPRGQNPLSYYTLIYKNPVWK
jgi:hypothetical protein